VCGYSVQHKVAIVQQRNPHSTSIICMCSSSKAIAAAFGVVGGSLGGGRNPSNHVERQLNGSIVVWVSNLFSCRFSACAAYAIAANAIQLSTMT